MTYLQLMDGWFLLYDEIFTPLTIDRMDERKKKKNIVITLFYN